MSQRGYYGFLVAGLIAGAISSVVIVLLFGFIHWGPQPYSKLKTELKALPKQADGIVTTEYFLVGLIKEQITYQAGFANGQGAHYYPNGSVYRDLYFIGGRLDGTIREYYEKTRNRPVSKHRAADAGFDPTSRGNLKYVISFSAGVKEGPYEVYYENGDTKEEGRFRAGKLQGQVKKYRKDGSVKFDRIYENGKVIQKIK